MVKRIICLGTVLLISFSMLCACGGNLQDQLDELQRKIEQQEDRIKELEEENRLLEEKLAELQKPVCTCYLLEPEIKGAFDFTDPKDEPLDTTNFNFEYFLDNQYLRVTFLKIQEGAQAPILELQHFKYADIMSNFGYNSEKPSWWNEDEIFRPSAIFTLFVENGGSVVNVIRYFEAQCFVKSVQLGTYI